MSAGSKNFTTVINNSIFAIGWKQYDYCTPGNSRIEVCEEVGCSYDTLTNWLRKYLQVSNVEMVSLSGRGGSNTLDASDVTEMEVMLYGGGGRDRLIGGANDDVLEGQGGRDRLAGKNGNDWLEGGNGRDTLFGDNGDDYLDGGSGNDVLDGGAGSDWFTIAPDAGTDTIADFSDGEDFLFLDSSLGFSDLSIVNNNAGTATLIQDANDDTRVFAVLDNVMAEDVTINDFV